jgi:hypothetical protein
MAKPNIEKEHHQIDNFTSSTQQQKSRAVFPTILDKKDRLFTEGSSPESRENLLQMRNRVE